MLYRCILLTVAIVNFYLRLMYEYEYDVGLWCSYHVRVFDVELLMCTVGICEKAKVIDVTRRQGTTELLTETRLMCTVQEKDLYLYYFLRQFTGRTLVFANSKDCIRRLSSVFGLLHCCPLVLHADMHQRQRLKNLDQFRSLITFLLGVLSDAGHGSRGIGQIRFMARLLKRPLNQALVSFGLGCIYVNGFLEPLFRFFVLFLAVIMFSFGCLAPVNRLAGKVVVKMTSDVSSITLSPTQLNCVYVLLASLHGHIC